MNLCMITPTYSKLTLINKINAFRMHGGGTCWFRTETDPDSIVGIPRVRHIWGDEAGKYRLYFWENWLESIEKQEAK